VETQQSVLTSHKINDRTCDRDFHHLRIRKDIEHPHSKAKGKLSLDIVVGEWNYDSLLVLAWIRWGSFYPRSVLTLTCI
jgi:hypothetical protein